jgi:oligopeptide/dipeptide ABC transporter ATP-binding protein
MSLLEVKGLTVRHGGKTVVDNLSFDLGRGESLGVVGESGSGKSQTVLALLGLLPEDAQVEGSVRFDDQELLGAGEATLNRIRAMRIGIVFQDPLLALNPYVSVGRQLCYILARHGLATGKDAEARVIGMLRRVGLPDAERQYRAYPHQLSGGMRQRVMIAAALIAEPDLLIADEPTTALDVTVQAQVLELLEELRESTALLLITHDLGVIAGHCKRMVVLRNGRLVEQGTTRDVFASPQDAHTAALIKAAPRLTSAPAPQANAGEVLLSVDDAVVEFAERGRGRMRAVRGVGLEVAEGETLAIVGESGSGKSSLVRAVLGLVPMHSGRVTFSGKRVAARIQKRARSIRRDLQLVFQDPAGSLNPRMRVASIVGEPLLVHEPGMPVGKRLERVTAVLAELGLGEDFLARYPHQLSGGEAQRVALARALILRPKVLVCDEAVAALDGTVRDHILAELRKVQLSRGLSIIFIAHDLAVVREISHRVLVMYMGKLVEVAGRDALFSSPRHPYTQALLEAVPVPDPDAPGGKALIHGEAPSALNPPSGCMFHPRCPLARDACKTDEPELRRVGATQVACHLVE